MVKNRLPVQETRDEGSALDQGNPLEEGGTTHSSVLDWRISQTEALGG